ncbi:MAG: EFR1 family ferrodoxin [Planctomycetes bacterium]|nr:EFR1 family ferrodoxin [Planctomycetota bacterium]
MSDNTLSTALIVYFSQTGATRRVAEAAAAGLEAQGLRCRTVDLLKADPAAAAEFDIIGIGTPVFYYKEPPIVRRFIERLPAARRKPAFTFITHGGNPVNTLRRLQKCLARRGYAVANSFSCNGFDSYPMYLKSFREWGRPSDEDLAAARDFGERLANECRWLRDEKRFATPKYRFVGGKYFLLSQILAGGMMKRTFPNHEVDPDVCTRCGTCARACPTQAITLAPLPTVNDDCIWCYLCERICPVQAFVNDWVPLRRKMKVE